MTLVWTRCSNAPPPAVREFPARLSPIACPLCCACALCVIAAPGFPWILSNVFDVKTSLPLANANEYVVLEWEGWRVGLLGLIEREWLATLAVISEKDVRTAVVVLHARLSSPWHVCVRAGNPRAVGDLQGLLRCGKGAV